MRQTALDQHNPASGPEAVTNWWNGGTIPNSARVGSSNGASVESGTIYWESGYLNLDPESLSSVDVVFTAPFSGTYVISGNFDAEDTNSQQHQVQILDNGSVIFNEPISLGAPNASFNLTETLKAGDTIDFAVDTGVGGNYGYLSTGLSATINLQVPVITAPQATQTVAIQNATPIVGVSVAESGSLASETFTVMLNDTSGKLAVSASEGTVSGSGTTSLSISGSLTQVNADLTTLTETETTAVDDIITVNASDGGGGNATPQLIFVATVSPTLTAPSSIKVEEFQTIDVSALVTSVNNPTSDTVHGMFMDAGGGTVYFVLNGVKQPDNQWIYFEPGDTLVYQAGSSPGTDTIEVGLHDETINTNYSIQDIAVTTPPPPTLAEYYDASEAVYHGVHGTVSGSPPADTGLTLLPIRSDSAWLADGFYGQAYEDANGNIIVSFEGTDPGESPFQRATLLADNQIFHHNIPQAFNDAYAFFEKVVQYDQQNLGSLPIYLTGHSLGAGEAEDVSYQTNGQYDGTTFATPGDFRITAPQASASLTDYLDVGDPIANYGPHYGNTVSVGSPDESPVLSQTQLEELASGIAHPLQVVGYLTNHYINNHLLGHYAADLGLNLDSQGYVAIV